MIYICEGCGFLFQRVSPVSECPFCENWKIRPASVEEADKLQQESTRIKRNTLKEE